MSQSNGNRRSRAVGLSLSIPHYNVGSLYLSKRDFWKHCKVQDESLLLRFVNCTMKKVAFCIPDGGKGSGRPTVRLARHVLDNDVTLKVVRRNTKDRTKRVEQALLQLQPSITSRNSRVELLFLFSTPSCQTRALAPRVRVNT